MFEMVCSWYAQLQNDCKNIYSTEYASSKGCVAEDLRNSELSYPIVVGLIVDGANGAMEEALQTRNDKDVEEALRILESAEVRNACLRALEEAGCGIEDIVAVWGRRETMTTATTQETTCIQESDAKTPEDTSMNRGLWSRAQ